MKKLKIVIIDYQLSNLFSVKHALNNLGIDAEITFDSTKIVNADAAILPGVGAFGDAMKNIKKLKLDKTIHEFIKRNKPFMGVCLGMQLLFSESEEFGKHQGLNIIKGMVKRFPTKYKSVDLKIPQVGWNNIYPQSKEGWSKSPFSLFKQNPYMYFVHSYYCIPSDKKQVLSLTNYEGFEFCSSVLHNQIFAVQFHPEKSGPKGIQIYKKWIDSFKNEKN